MRAMRFQRVGLNRRLIGAELPRPSPGQDELLVKVAYAAINPVDWKLHGGLLEWLPIPGRSDIPCFDFAGRVAAIAEGVDRFTVGQRVFGMLRPRENAGAAAEYLTVRAELAAAVPDGLDFASAAGLPLAGLTALQALRRGNLSFGSRLLVIGASGGVGHLGIQLGKCLGAEVTGICSGANVELVRSLGADSVIDYTQGLPADIEPFDVILDAVVNRPCGQWLRWLKPNGWLFALLPTPSAVFHGLSSPLTGKQQVRIVMAKANGTDVAALAELAQQGRVRVSIDRVVKLSELEQGFALSKAGRTRGKIVVEIDAGA